MARVRLNTKTAERAAAAPPKRKAGVRADPAEQAKRVRIMHQLALHSATHEQQLAAMQHEFPDITEDAVRRLRAQAEKAILSQTVDSRLVKRMKQEQRILGHISSAKSKGAYGAVASLEREYSNVAGTAAPIRVQHEHSYTESFQSAFKKAVSQLTSEQTQGLLKGETVALGFTADGPVVETTGEGRDDE